MIEPLGLFALTSLGSSMNQPSDNPYEPPKKEHNSPSRLSDSVFDEPHLQNQFFPPDQAAEWAAERAIANEPTVPTDAIDHSVWDEPGLAVSVPESALTYAKWLSQQEAATSELKSLLVTFAIVLVSGVWAVIGALMFQSSSGSSGNLLTIVVIAPITEEVMKIALATWAVEKRPYLFKSSLQIVLCALAGGLCFAAMENLIYLNVYIPNPTANLITWRWTVCVALHTSCSLIAGWGLVKVWRRATQFRQRPQLIDGSRQLVTAVVIHCAYNSLAWMFYR
ncbi:MAG: PrsW family glutamic-type intramembrane protease [Pirellulaceae bacterium]